MKLSYVLLTWNRYKFLEKCLEALTVSTEDSVESEIIVMDNGSTDRTQEVLRRYQSHPRVRIVIRDKNYGLNSYKKLFALASGEYVIIVDDDVLELPAGLNGIFIDYMETFPDYGFLALNVIQNEYTEGAKPGPENYTDETRAGKTIERGPTGGWCACFRRREYRKIRWVLAFSNVNMKRSEDGLISKYLWKLLSLKSGLIKDVYCLHASGPHYAKLYGHLDREVEKYASAGLTSYVETYKQYYDDQEK